VVVGSLPGVPVIVGSLPGLPGVVGLLPGLPGVVESLPGVVGSCAGVRVLHVVWMKHDSPYGQSRLLPDGQGIWQDEASSKLFPHMNESFSSHEVYGKQNVPLGQSLSLPPGQGNRQFDDAWFQSMPQ